jgi:hypothetical protein
MDVTDIGAMPLTTVDTNLAPVIVPSAERFSEAPMLPKTN